MKRNQFLVFAVIGMTLIAAAKPAGAAMITGFTGEMAPGNWSMSNGNLSNPGSYGFPTDTKLDIYAGSGTLSSSVLVSLLASSLSTASTISFKWKIVKNGELGTPTANYYLGTSGAIALTGGLSGQVNYVTVPTSSDPDFPSIAFSFASGGTSSDAKSPAMLEIEIVPEAGNWMAGVFLLGIGVVSIRRRKSAVTA